MSTTATRDRRSAAGHHPRRHHSTPAYMRGIPSDVWLTALERNRLASHDT